MTITCPTLVGCLIIAALTTPLTAQESAGRTGRALRGIIYDSVAARPLAGASVQLAERDGLRAPRTVLSDSAGRYRFDGIPAGRYVLGFYHDALTTLGLDAPTRAVEVTADADVTADLAVPSSQSIRALRCGTSSEFAPGMLVGFVRDANNRAAIAGTKATVHWRAFALDSANYRVVAERSTATIEGDGAMLACNLPLDVPLDLLVTAPGHREVAGSVVAVPASGIGRLDILLADSALTTGSAVIRGKVTRESGRPVGSGRVVIKSLGREVVVQNGEFVAANVPAGTWVAEARVIGVEPQDVLVTASDSAVVTTTIEVSNGPQRLDAVTVVGKPNRDLRVLDDVLRRKRVGSSTTFLPGHPALRSATFVSDVMREARGFAYQGPTKIVGRMRGLTRCENVAVYVNDVRQSDGFDGLDDIAPIGGVLAIETWADLDFAPVQYRQLQLPTLGKPSSNRQMGRLATPAAPVPCALVLIWTRQR